MYIYLTFLLTFYFTSGLIFINDIYYKKEKKKLIQYKNILPVVLKNTFIYIPVITIPYEYTCLNNQDLSYIYSLFRIVSGIILIDFFFYISHRIMHIPKIYKWSHKLHHIYKEPVCIEALYLHWFDLYIGNIVPIYLPIIYTNINIHIIYTLIIIANTLLSHSDLIDNFHRNHHLYFNCNFGLGYYMDKIFNTKYLK